MPQILISVPESESRQLWSAPTPTQTPGSLPRLRRLRLRLRLRARYHGSGDSDSGLVTTAPATPTPAPTPTPQPWVGVLLQHSGHQPAYPILLLPLRRMRGRCGVIAFSNGRNQTRARPEVMLLLFPRVQRQIVLTPLALDSLTSLCTSLDLNLAHHTSSLSLRSGSMSPTDRRSCWLERRVFFLTPQVLNNDLTTGSCPADLLRCVVIDEAHKVCCGRVVTGHWVIGSLVGGGGGVEGKWFGCVAVCGVCGLAYCTLLMYMYLTLFYTVSKCELFYFS